MFVGGISWIWFTYNPLNVPVLGGNLDAVLTALPLSFVAFIIGNRFGKVLNTGFAPASGVVGTEVNTSGLTMEEYKKETKVEWLGVDGALCLLYAILACIYGFGIINRVDWIIGWMAPIMAASMTTLIFLRYLFQVFQFSKKADKTAQ